MKRLLTIFGLVAFVFAIPRASANNLMVSNITSVSIADATNALFGFDIAWDNSWRTTTHEANMDAAWVFAKWRTNAAAPWLHATLATNGHTAAAGSEIVSVPNGAGVWVQRSMAGTGDVDFPGLQLQWLYAVDNAPLQAGSTVDVAVCAVEMVYIPGGAFQLGSGGAEDGHFYSYPDTSTTFTVASEAAIPTSMSATALWGTGGTNGSNAVAPTNNSSIPAAFPKGFDALYCMKYEISQGQYAEFLNRLTPAQATVRFPNSSGLRRHTITNISGVYTATVPDRACNFLSSEDGATYADWSGLRPMTELEYEKACRGTNAPAANEYAWGNNSVFLWPFVVTNDGLPYATIANLGYGKGNAATHITSRNTIGPLRCAIFAASLGAPNRPQSGASFYGVMELSGNVHERVVGVGDIPSRAFQGTHGNGTITVGGEPTNSDWPNVMGVRGGSWEESHDRARVSDRYRAVIFSDAREEDSGFRCVRTAPQ